MNLSVSAREYARFIKNHKVDTLLLLLLALMNAILPLPKEVSVSLPIIVFLLGSVILFRQHMHGKLHEKLIEFTNKLRVLVEEFKDKISAHSYSYSLPSIALTIANDKEVMKKTEAWNRFLLTFSNNLTKEANALYDRIKESNGKQFSNLFDDFSKLLSHLTDFKREFYNMIKETRDIANFGLDTRFRMNFYNRFSEEYNGYMDRLANFSDDLKAELGLTLNRDLIEHVLDLKELYKV